MSEEKTDFYRWTRDKQRAFSKAVMKVLESKFPTIGGTITGPIVIDLPPTRTSPEHPITFKVKYSETSTGYTWRISLSSVGDIAYVECWNRSYLGMCPSLGLFPANPNNTSFTLGYWNSPWPKVYAKKLNNGNDIEIPTKGGTLALVSDIEDILRKHKLIPDESETQTEQA